MKDEKGNELTHWGGLDNKTKQGESTPEEIIGLKIHSLPINKSNIQHILEYGSINGSLFRDIKYLVLNEIEMARKSEREKVISIIKEKMKALDKTAGVFPGTTFNVYINQAEVVEILTNLKKEKGE